MFYVKVGGNMCCMGGGKPSSGERQAAVLHRFHISYFIVIEEISVQHIEVTQFFHHAITFGLYSVSRVCILVSDLLELSIFHVNKESTCNEIINCIILTFNCYIM